MHSSFNSSRSTMLDGTTKIFVGNLPETCRKGQLQALFEKYGKVVECDIVKNYGFVHYSDVQEAKTAVANLDGVAFEGTNIRVELSHSKVRQRPGMGGKGECFRCGREGHWSKNCPRAPQNREFDTMGPPPPQTDLYAPEPYRDPYTDPYYRERYAPPPPPVDRYRPYPDPYERRPPPPMPPRDPYYRERVDPYARPPPEYYGRRSPPRDPYYDEYYRRGFTREHDYTSYPSMGPPPPQAGRVSPPRSRVPGPY